MVVGELRGDLLVCPHCRQTRFTKLTPPYSAASEARCGGCNRDVRLAELEPHLAHAPPLPSVSDRALA